MIPTLVRHCRLVLLSPTGRTLLVNGAILALGFITSIALAHWLGPSGRGELAAALLWPPMLAGLAQMGLTTAITYEAASGDSSGDVVFGVGVVLGLVQSAAAVLLGHLLLPSLLRSQSPDVVDAARTFLWVVPLTVLTQYGLALLAARLRFAALNAIRLIVPIGYIVGAFLLHEFRGLTPSGVVLVLLGFNVFTLIGTLGALRVLGIVRTPRFERGAVRRLVSYGSKAYVGTLAYTANARLDQGMLSAWFAPAQLGLYVTAVSAANLSQLLTHAVQQVLMPTIASQEGGAERLETLRRAFRKYAMISVAMNAALLLSLPLLLPFLFGDAFRDAVLPAMILVVAITLLGAKDVLASGAQALGDPWLGSRAELAGAGVVVVVLLALVPTLGIVGAAVSALVSYGTQLAIVLIALRRRHAVPLRALIRPGGPLPRHSTVETTS